MTFERIYSYIVDKVPQLAPKGTYCIHEWLACGYDPELDVIPAVDIVCKKGTRSIAGFGWFTNAIRWCHERRLKEAQKPKEIPAQNKEERRAATIKIKQRVGIFVSDSELGWLESYEKREVHA